MLHSKFFGRKSNWFTFRFLVWLSFLHESLHGCRHDPSDITLRFGPFEWSCIEKYCAIEEGAIIRRSCITQRTETFQYSVQNRKKVAVTIQVFVGTKTGWFRGFCSYYVKRGEDGGEMCSGNERGKRMRWHTRIFSVILLYIRYTPPLLKKSWIARDWSCVCDLIARATKLP
jgi:hypothetical protein